MPDWKKIVGEKLGCLPLNNGRQEDVIEELAQQLESAYEDALAQGMNEQEAICRGLAQFKDWEKLRSEVFQSVEGTQLPVWEQNGISAPRRLPVWIALAVALAFLLLPSFRKVLQVLPLSSQRDAWDTSAFSADALRRIERSGDKGKYARTLAYVALHNPDDHQAMLAAEKAIALDPQLAWISARVSHANYLIPGYDPKPWINRLKAWDRDNAYVYLLEAGASVHQDWEKRWAKFTQLNGELRRALVQDPSWRIAMEKAFSAPRFEIYSDRQFLLERGVLLERGLDRPDKLMLAAASVQFPDFTLVKMYADYLRLEVGESEEKKGHPENALAAYQSVASFGQKLQADSTPMAFQHTFSATLRKDAYEKMIPLLRREGRHGEAAVVESALAAVRAEEFGGRKLFERLQRSPAYRSGQIILVCGLFLILFALAAALWFACVALLSVEPNLSRAMNWLGSHLGWAPVLLPLSSLCLFISFFPYSRSISEYSAAEDLFATFGSLYAGVGSLRLDPILDVWIDHMFWPLLWCAVMLLLGALCLRLIAWSRHTDQSGVE
jgi:hypothetical protein